ncbi:hypothetical protein N2152v2_004116 [Parachlorella kessleri]
MAAKKGSVEELVLATVEKHAEGASNEVLEAELPDLPLEQRAVAINSLLQAERIQLLLNPTNNQPVYKPATSAVDNVKFKGLTAEDVLVYQTIKNAGNTGIWTRDMRHRTNLTQPRINKTLKTLEERALVKSVKSVQNASRKVYMLMELEPAKEITGGPWYGADSFDNEFVEVLQKATFSFIRSQGQATLQEIADFIKDKGISKQALQADDMLHIVQTLEFDGLIDQVTDEEDITRYRQALLKTPDSNAFTALPCGVCPVISECEEGGKISPQTCIYYSHWLNF